MAKNVPEIDLDKLFHGRLCLYQKKRGYRFSVDAVLLGCFAARKAVARVADLGTGSGVLPVILSKCGAVEKITGIELQKDLASLAKKNISHNGCSEKVDVLCTDIKKIKEVLSPETFDTVVTNPPFYRIGSGKVNPENENAIARHELKATLHDFLTGAAFLLKQGGRFFAVYRPSRITDLVHEMRECRIEPKVFQFVHPSANDPANIVLVEGIKGAGTEAKIVPPLILYQEDGKYTEQANAVFAGI